MISYLSRRDDILKSLQGSAEKGTLTKEDATFICVEALDAVPEKGLIFEVANGEEKVEDWKKRFAALMETSAQ